MTLLWPVSLSGTHATILIGRYLSLLPESCLHWMLATRSIYQSLIICPGTVTHIQFFSPEQLVYCQLLECEENFTKYYQKQIEYPTFNLTCISFACRRKPEYPKETHMGRTEAPARIWSRTFLLWGNSAPECKHRAALAELYLIYKYVCGIVVGGDGTLTKTATKQHDKLLDVNVNIECIHFTYWVGEYRKG